MVNDALLVTRSCGLLKDACSDPCAGSCEKGDNAITTGTLGRIENRIGLSDERIHVGDRAGRSTGYMANLAHREADASKARECDRAVKNVWFLARPSYERDAVSIRGKDS